MSKDTVKPLEYTYKKLHRMKREELDAIAEGFNIVASRFPNKAGLVTIILEECGGEGKNGLSKREELFCELYATQRDVFGNGTDAYIEAYEIDASTPGAYASARACASRLLMDVNVLSRINEHLKGTIANDTVVDMQNMFWVMQKAHPMASIAAIKIYNEVNRRIDNKLNGAIVNLTQNNYEFSIRDEHGRNVSQQFTDYMMEKTKAPQEVSSE